MPGGLAGHFMSVFLPYRCHKVTDSFPLDRIRKNPAFFKSAADDGAIHQRP